MCNLWAKLEFFIRDSEVFEYSVTFYFQSMSRYDRCAMYNVQRHKNLIEVGVSKGTEAAYLLSSANDYC